MNNRIYRSNPQRIQNFLDSEDNLCDLKLLDKRNDVFYFKSTKYKELQFKIQGRFEVVCETELVNHTQWLYTLDTFCLETPNVKIHEVLLKASLLYLEYTDSVEKSENDESIFKMLNEHPEKIKDASLKLKDDKETFEFLLAERGKLIQYASKRLQNDRELALIAIKEDTDSLEFFSEHIKNDKEIMIEAIRLDSSAISFASKKLLEEKDFILEVISKYGGEKYLTMAPKKLLHDENFLKEALTKNPKIFKNLKSTYRENFELCLLACQKYGDCIKFASEHLRNDQTIIKAAITQNASAVQYISKKLKQSEEIINLVIEMDPNAIIYIPSSRWNNNREIAKKVLAKNGELLEHFEMKNDKEIVTIAVSNKSEAILFASEELKNDKELVMIALSRNPNTIRHLSKKFKEDKEIFSNLIEKNPNLIVYSSNMIKKDKEIILKVVQKDGLLIQNFDLKNQNREIVEAAVSQNPSAIEYCAPKYREDASIMLKVIEQDSKLMSKAGGKLLKDKEFIFQTIKFHGENFIHADEVFKNDFEFVKKVVTQDGSAFRYCHFKHDSELLMLALETDWFVLSIADESLRSDQQIAMKAVEKDKRALIYIKNHTRELLLHAMSFDKMAFDFAQGTIMDDAELQWFRRFPVLLKNVPLRNMNFTFSE
eukprot:gene2578-3540_t